MRNLNAKSALFRASNMERAAALPENARHLSFILVSLATDPFAHYVYIYIICDVCICQYVCVSWVRLRVFFAFYLFIFGRLFSFSLFRAGALACFSICSRFFGVLFWLVLFYYLYVFLYCVYMCVCVCVFSNFSDECVNIFFFINTCIGNIVFMYCSFYEFDLNKFSLKFYLNSKWNNFWFMIVAKSWIWIDV